MFTAYLDNSATTAVCPQAAAAAMKMMTEVWANPASLYRPGMEAAAAVEEARAAVARRLGAAPEEIIFTSGGTEGNNLALFSGAAAGKKRGKRIVTTAGEHPSVLNCAKELEKEGFEVVYLPLQPDGAPAEEDVRSAVNADTVLVSMMLVNNETGAVFPVRAARRAIEASGAPALLHCDAVQAFGKAPFFKAAQLAADLITVSGHKLGAPKGIGAIYLKKGVHLSPRTFGGGQERGLRSGTPSVPLIAAFGAAVQALDPVQAEYIPALKSALVQALLTMPGVFINSPEGGSPYIVNFSVPGIPSEVLLHFLESRGVYVSSGSACARGQTSHVLAAMGLPRSRIESAVRVSFCPQTTQAETDLLLSALREGLASIIRKGNAK